MAGRKPKLNWTPSRGQFTCTVNGHYHLLGPDKDDAERQFQFITQKADFGEEAHPNPTFHELADRWLEHVEKSYSVGRYRHCKARLREFITFVGQGTRVKELRAGQVEQWLASKQTTQAPGTKRLYSAIILAVLNWAANRKVRLLASNPLRGMIELPEGGSRGEDAVWPSRIIKLVLKHANSAFADVVRILAWTGARPSTICKIEARHFRPAHGLWDVEDLYKDRKSKRKYVKRIRLAKKAKALVEHLNAQYPEGPIFRNAHGKPWSPDTLGVYLYQMRHKFEATKGLDWPEGLCLYGLRHTFATAWLAAHPDKIEYLRVLLGHKDYKMIFKHYGHLIDQHEVINKALDDFDVF